MKILTKPLRLWPGVTIVILQWLIRFILPLLISGVTVYSFGGGLLGGLAIVVWWAFFSRAPRFERWIAILLMVAALVATSRFLDKSVSTAMMGMMFIFYSIPVLSLAFVTWAVASRHLPVMLRRVTMVATILLASGSWVFIRTNGMDGEAHQSFDWRWAKTSEDNLLARADDKLGINPADPAELVNEAEWPGFRGINRDGINHGLKIGTDWHKSPPVEIWRRSIGPGCSSFAIQSPLLYTQEQRGEYEMITCYNLNSGKPVWQHSDKVRFWDSHAGAGPRSTPTLSNGRVYTLGATGILNVLDALDGTLIWSRNAAGEANVKIPGWGYSGSPLVVDSIVLVPIAGKLLAYDLVKGSQLWTGSDGGESYSSPQLFTIDGIKQIVFMNNGGVNSYGLADGKVFWNLPLKGGRIVQPAMISASDILIDAGDMKGMKRLSINDSLSKWTINEVWTTKDLKPYFNDYVIHKGFAYGIDGPNLVCVDISNGTRRWRGGRYGGQLILLADQDILLIISEKGDLVLAEANPDKFTELARFHVIEGRTWNHPALAGDILVVRNSEEMAAFRLIRQN